MKAELDQASLMATGIVKTYARTTHALRGVDLSLSQGTTALLGRNGAGKSTLVRILVGLENPTQGSVELNLLGENLRNAAFNRELGWLPQAFGFPGTMNAGEFVRYAAWLKGIKRASMQRHVTDALEFAGVGGEAKSRLGTLSGGTLRRVGLAAAVVHRPTVLLLDEPTAGLDPIQRSAFHERLRQLADSTVVLVATHLLEDVEAVASGISVLDGGRVVWSGTKAGLAGVAGQDPGIAGLRAGFSALVQGGLD